MPWLKPKLRTYNEQCIHYLTRGNLLSNSITIMAATSASKNHNIRPMLMNAKPEYIQKM
jgi:hypothetical protein